jgi:argininosuccinate lyase
VSAPPEATNTQLWAKGLPLDAALHQFTVGEDPVLDMVLIPFDTLGSAAHALTLAKDGFIPAADARALVAALQQIRDEAQAGKFVIRPEQEDGHTAIEARLVELTGDAGKRIHLGRSRNDQVMLALRLLARQELVELGRGVTALAAAFIEFAREHGETPMPGYTHLRRAMPSSLGQWSSAFAESLLEELEQLQALYQRLDRCPAGAAAGFGAPVALDRAHLAKLLGFARVQRNPVNVQNSRGRHELAVLQAIASIGMVLEKWLWDLALYSTEEFGFLRLPPEFTTGSSIMPQKRNPDVVELARATCRELRGHAAMAESLGTGLPSNYHRDMQLLKKPLLDGLARGRQLLDVLARLVPGIEPVPEKLADAHTPELLAAAEASRRVSEGQTFRDAYRDVGAELIEGTFKPPDSHDAGRVGNDYLDEIDTELRERKNWLKERAEWHARHAEKVWIG